MKPAIYDASVRRRNDNGLGRPRRPDITEVESQIAGLANRSTQELRVAWRQLHRTGPPLGLSRDLLIRALAHQLQERTHGGPSRALRRRLQSLVGASERGTMAVDPGLMLKTGTTLVRQWRGHMHTVLVHNDGFEHEGQRYRSLTAIAERITEAHWSGPRFFGLTRARVLWQVPRSADDATNEDREFESVFLRRRVNQGPRTKPIEKPYVAVPRCALRCPRNSPSRVRRPSVDNDRLGFRREAVFSGLNHCATS